MTFDEWWVENKNKKRPVRMRDALRLVWNLGEQEGRKAGFKGEGMSANDDFARSVYHLIGWGEWRRQNRGSVTRGYPSKSAGVSSGGGSEEFDALVEKEDAKAAAICDAVIDDLAYLYRAVLESEYIMQGVFRSGRQNTQDLLIDAQAAFWAKAKRLLT